MVTETGGPWGGRAGEERVRGRGNAKASCFDRGMKDTGVTTDQTVHLRSVHFTPRKADALLK